MAQVDAEKVLKIKASETKRASGELHRLGGRSLPDSHRGNAVVFDKETYPRHMQGAGGHTCGCGLPARAALPYTNIKGEEAYVTICLVCDGGAIFPRLAEKERAGESSDSD